MLKKNLITCILIFALVAAIIGQNNYNSKNKYYADFYVSSQGNDNWSGRLEEPNEDKTDGPFATIDKAKNAVRLIKRCTYRNIFVLIRGGEYNIRETIIFSPEDSHYDSYSIVYMAYPEESPVFSSDVEITGWELGKKIKGLPKQAIGRVYVANLPLLINGKERFYTLYENGRLLTRAHSPGFEPTKHIKGGDGGGLDWSGMMMADRNIIHFPEGILKNWPNLEDIEVFIQPNVGYVTNYLTLASVDEVNNTAKTVLPATYPMGKISKHLHAISGGSCRVENVIDYLNKPGDWVVNTKEGKIYYWPLNGSPLNVTYPALNNYFFVDGHEKNGIVRNIKFQGLTFTRGEREVITKNDIGLQHEWDMWNKANTLLRFRNVEYCIVDGCRFTNSGGGAIRFDLHAQSNIIKNNLIDYVGGTGILLCGYGPGKINVSKGNRIINNHIHHCGEFYYHSNGIMLFQSGENIVRNNKLHNLPYNGIALTGTRPMFFQATIPNREQVGTIRTEEIEPDALFQESKKDFSTYSTTDFLYFDQWPKSAPYYHTRNNLIEENDIFLVMQKCYDGNGIYLSDVGDGNEIIRNYIHHLNGIGMQQAIRTDANIKNTTISENVLYNINGGGINLKFYENNAYNNIIADVRQIVYENDRGKINRVFVGFFSLMGVFNRDKMPPRTGCFIQRNILYKTQSNNTFFRQGVVNGKLSELKLEECNIDYNLYFDVNLKDNGQAAIEHYRTRGVDQNSIVADPLFRDIKNGDFRLMENSPAFKLGFKDIDMKSIGLTENFPAKYTIIVKNQLGKNYDDFKFLEEKCSNINDTKASFIPVEGI